MRLVTDYARVRVPATSGNLGPGFDSMGMAHDLWDDVSVTMTTGATHVTILGEGKDDLPRDESHLTVRAMRAALAFVDAPAGGIELVARNGIYQGRGLGSSAAAVVAGILLVRGLIDHPEVLDDATVLELATEFEGHPDNAAPAIYGGATVSWHDGEHWATANVNVAPNVHTTLLVPNEMLPTTTARSVLPEHVPHADAAFNASRSALLTHALANDPKLLFAATADRLHQSYRADAMPQTSAVLGALRDAGWPAVVSGAGPSILVFASLDTQMTRILQAQGFAVVPSRQVRGAYLVDAR